MAMEASSCVTEGGHQRLLKARISLGPDRSNLVVPNDSRPLSEKLLELKRLCMDCIGTHLVAHNALAAAAGDGDSVLDDEDVDPFQEDISGGDEEEAHAEAEAEVEAEAEAEAEQAKKAGTQQKKRNLKQK
jgi:hypothetical protein